MSEEYDYTKNVQSTMDKYKKYDHNDPYKEPVIAKSTLIERIIDLESRVSDLMEITHKQSKEIEKIIKLIGV